MNKKRAFTLVELLVVVAIIGILSSLVTVGVMAAMQSAKRARIAMEMHQISLALESYKNKFGEYPPDLYDVKAVVRHVKKRWPRFELYHDPSDIGTGITKEHLQYRSLMNAVCNVYRNSNKVDILKIHGYNSFSTGTIFMDDESSVTQLASYIGALPFWLGGFPSEDGKFIGFSADPEAPFGRQGTTVNDGNYNTTWVPNNITLGTPDKDSVLYEMVIGKNIAYVITTDATNNIVFPVLVNVLRSDLRVPYVYFRGKSEGRKKAYTYRASDSPDTYRSKYYDFANINQPELGIASPYAKSGDPNVTSNDPIIWYEPERFQLIHPGLDSMFGLTSTASTVPFEGSPSTDIFNILNFRSINTNVTGYQIGQKDFDNITNFSDYQQIKSILP